MRIELGTENLEAETLLPERKDDGSGIGINHADAYIKPFKRILDDGRKVSCTRRGLQLTLCVGERKGAGLMRRLEHGPDVRSILREALREAATHAGYRFDVDESRRMCLEPVPSEHE